MINLLPYSRRALLKSLYKKRLVVVSLFAFSAVLIPMLCVLIVTSYSSYSNTQALNKKFENLENLRKEEGVDDLTDEVKTINLSIGNFKQSVSSTKPVSLVLENIISVKPSNLKILSFDFSSKEKDILVISGISGVRDSIIKYGDVLGKKGKNFCKEVSVPITTYAKKNDVPFVITCELNYEAK